MQPNYNFRSEIRKIANLKELLVSYDLLPKGDAGVGASKDVIKEVSARAVKLARAEAKLNPYEAKQQFEALKKKIDEIPLKETTKAQSLFTRIFGSPIDKTLKQLGKMVDRRKHQVQKLYSQLDKIGDRFNFHHDDAFFKGEPALFLKTMELQLQYSIDHSQDKKAIREEKKGLSLIQQIQTMSEKIEIPSDGVLKAKLDDVLQILKARRPLEFGGDWMYGMTLELRGHLENSSVFANQGLAIMELMKPSSMIVQKKKPEIEQRLPLAQLIVKLKKENDKEAKALANELETWVKEKGKVPLNSISAFYNRGLQTGKRDDREQTLVAIADALFREGAQKDAFLFLQTSMRSANKTVVGEQENLRVSPEFKAFIDQTMSNLRETGQFFPGMV